jgi:hypothetical protein
MFGPSVRGTLGRRQALKGGGEIKIRLLRNTSPLEGEVSSAIALLGGG